jgi:hypothetical protein
VPLRQGSAGWHAAPWAQPTHPPVPLQTNPTPHGVPSAAAPAAMHEGSPVAHCSTPTTHAMPVLHVAPSAQPTQPPSRWQTRSVPHAVPGARAPVTSHTGTPDPQTVAPTRQGDGLQASPASQPMQPPSGAHTRPGAQNAPGGTWPAAVQPPSAQSRMPNRQGSAALQTAPSMHTVAHRPFAHCSPLAQVTPTHEGSRQPSLTQAWPAGQGPASHEAG